ncbi:MAG: ABC transporter ATP-binding protein/permease [Symbiobacteriaceae bacterium]|nr:ABC transporter ATP-binding protein/permease [Symbiobacteriaceae bacterium]
MRRYLDAVAAGAALPLMYQATIVYTVLSLLRQGAVVIYEALSEMVGLAATDALRVDTVAHCLALDLSYHKERTPGEMISRLDSDLNSISAFFGQFWTGIIVAILTLLGAIGMILWLEPYLGAILSVSTALFIVISIKLKDLAAPYTTAHIAALANHFSNLEEHLAAAEDIKGNGVLAYTFSRFWTTLQAWKVAHRNSYIANSVTWTILQFAFSVNTLLTFAYCWYIWQQGAMQVSTAFMLVLYSEQLRRPLSEIRVRLQSMQRAEGALRRLGETLAVQPKIGDTGDTPVPVSAPCLTFADVSFAYEKENWVLRKLSFTLSPGSSLGLLGHTGSGKSSLARLILRFYEPQQGEILLDNTTLAMYPLALLRRSVAFVTQEVQLFNASVRDNLTFFDSSYNDTLILQALTKLGLQTWLEELPRGLDTLLGEEVGLSAGESQLLAIARAFLRQPTVVILDEASARLDPVTEKRVTSAVQELLAGRTAIVIAHRLDTLEQMDNLMVLEQGSILEFGTYQELNNNPNSQFNRLRQQMEGVEYV